MNSHTMQAAHQMEAPVQLSLPAWGGAALFVLALLFAALPSGLNWEAKLSEEMMEGSWIVRLQWTSLFVCAWFLMRYIPLTTMIGHVKENWPLLVLMAFCTLSIAWSDFPGIVVKRFVQFVGVVSILVLVASFHEEHFDRLMVATLWIALALCGLSIVFALAVPRIGIETAVGIEGTWKGILGQKNQLGLFSAMSIYFTVFCLSRRVVSPLFAGVVIATCAVCLLMSRSSSSATLTVLSLSIFLLLRREFIRSFAPIVRVMLLAGLVLCVVYLGFYFVNARFPETADILAPFAALFGKSTDLTGRGDIWEIMWRTIAKHPYLGVGYSSFWLGPGGPSQFISDELMWTVPSAHNGYLEVINELGWIGFALFVGMLVHHAFKLMELFRYERDTAAFHMGLLAIFLVSNFSESTALRVLAFLQFVMLFSMIMVAATLQRVRPWNGSHR
ncbi:MAG TPA: O-antigen ligase family protein [Burkholderiaceae bacterium]|nr:O-antigen ligase family protein [Burkholderiaceae bacterium]